MPELPDLEAARRLLTWRLTGQVITAVEVPDADVFRNVPAELAARMIERRRVGPVDRQGKWLQVHTDGPTAMVHLGMTGTLRWTYAPKGELTRDRVRLRTSDGAIALADPRRLSGVWLLEPGHESDEVTGRLGPDASSITDDGLAGILSAHRGSVKATMMNQAWLAGLGNTLSDEILWRAGVHPGTRADRLGVVEVQAIRRSMKSALDHSVRVGRIPRTARWLASQRASKTPQCPRCGASLERSRFGSRTSVWCPRCQPVDGPSE